MTRQTDLHLPQRRAEIQDWLVARLAVLLDMHAAEIDPDKTFDSLGCDSVIIFGVTGELEDWLARPIDPKLVFNYRSISALSLHLSTLDNRANPCNGRSIGPEATPPVRKPDPLGGSPDPSPDPLGGSMAEFANPSGQSLQGRVAAYDAWRVRRREAGVWPFCRLVQSPAAPSTVVSEEGEISRPCINFASQDYLGLARDPRVLRKAQEAIAEYGVHSAGSPVLLGTTAPMAELERTLSTVIGKEDCLVFPTGWAAGFGVITGLVRAHDTLVLDALCHRCLMEGAFHVSRDPLVFRHNDLDHLSQTLRRAREQDPANGLFVVAESLYSMDSDSPDLPAMVRLIREFDAILILDIAHDFGAMGLRGLGLLEQLDGTDLAPDVVMGSFSKTFAATGGFVASDRAVVDYLRGHTTSFVFSNAISPVQAAAALECCEIAFSDEGRQLREHLSRNVLALRLAMQAADCRVAGTPSPIVPVIVGDDREARLIARQIARIGLLANLVEYPAVPRARARFRFQVMSTHTPKIAREAAALFLQAAPRGGRFIARTIR